MDHFLSPYYYWHNTATCGTFGASVAVAKLLNLKEDQIISALGSAGTQAAGLWEFIEDGAMSKQLHPGKAAMNGPFIIFYLECVISSLTKVLNELLRYDKIKHIREILKGYAKTMFELIARMEDGEVFHSQLFDDTLDASPSSIAKNLSKLKDLDVIKHGDERGEYIVSIVE